MKLSARVRIKENSFAARIAAWKLNADSVALVLGKTIHLYNVTEKEFLQHRRWVQHELKHIEQFERYGTIKFLLLYLLEWTKNGYANNRFEKEAREAETSLE
jgi:hypothetical protein